MQPVRVKVTLSYKINMGEGTFETLGVEYGMEADALEKESASQAFARIEDFISDKLFAEVKRVKDTL